MHDAGDVKNNSKNSSNFDFMQFSQVIGHEALKSHLIREVNSGKVSHAQLFLGKPGYGTLPMALAFVQYLFCENRQTTDSCGKCASCQKTAALQHPDLHFAFPVVLSIDKLSDAFIVQWREQIAEQPYFDLNQWTKRIDPKERKPTIGTDQSQEIIKKLVLKSYEGGYKVMLIWMAEEMNATCANKLLKILEEPPEKTLIVLVGESSDKLLQTIKSRTQLVKIPRPQTDDVISYLRMTKGAITPTIDSAIARAEGDLIELNLMLAEDADQQGDRDDFMQLMRVCYKKDVIQMMDWADKMGGSSKERQKQFLIYALHMFRQSLMKNYTDDQLTRVSKEENDFLNKFAPFITGNNIQDFTAAFNKAHYHIDRNANSRLLFTVLCFNVMRYIHKA
jgi:DNA polymerase-3 subunit delta'